MSAGVPGQGGKVEPCSKLRTDSQVLTGPAGASPSSAIMLLLLCPTTGALDVCQAWLREAVTAQLYKSISVRRGRYAVDDCSGVSPLGVTLLHRGATALTGSTRASCASSRSLHLVPRHRCKRDRVAGCVRVVVCEVCARPYTSTIHAHWLMLSPNNCDRVMYRTLPKLL
jgi:hypothetical protein